MESLARLLFTGGGLPPFEIQVEIVAAGYRVLHLTWAQVVHEPDRTVAAIGRLLAA